MRTKKELCQTIVYYLIDNNISVEEFAKKLDASKQSVYRWMNGKEMSDRYYIKLSKIMEGYDATKWNRDIETE